MDLVCDLPSFLTSLDNLEDSHHKEWVMEQQTVSLRYLNLHGVHPIHGDKQNLHEHVAHSFRKRRFFLLSQNRRWVCNQFYNLSTTKHLNPTLFGQSLQPNIY